jgi:hypothetical protein
MAQGGVSDLLSDRLLDGMPGADACEGSGGGGTQARLPAPG